MSSWVLFRLLVRLENLWFFAGKSHPDFHLISLGRFLNWRGRRKNLCLSLELVLPGLSSIWQADCNVMLPHNRTSRTTLWIMDATKRYYMDGMLREFDSLTEVSVLPWSRRTAGADDRGYGHRSAGGLSQLAAVDSVQIKLGTGGADRLLEAPPCRLLICLASLARSLADGI